MSWLSLSLFVSLSLPLPRQSSEHSRGAIVSARARPAPALRKCHAEQLAARGPDAGVRRDRQG